MNREELIVEALASVVHEEDGWLSDAQTARLEWDADNRVVRFHGEGSIDLAHLAEIVSSVFDKANTPTEAYEKPLDTSPEPVKNGGDSLHVTPTDDERAPGFAEREKRAARRGSSSPATLARCHTTSAADITRA